MAFTDIGRITDSSDRALAAIERARAVVGDAPDINARLDRLADQVEETRDGAIADCALNPLGVVSDDCTRAVSRMETIARAAIAAAEEVYTRYSEEDKADDGAPGSAPPPPPGAPSSLTGAILLAASSAAGFLLGVLR